MSKTTYPRPQVPHAPLLVELAAQWLADGLSAPSDPISADPAQLMTAAGLVPDAWQARLMQSHWQRALLLCSRQSGKSTVCAALATWLAQYEPESLILLLSAAQRQSGELFRKVKNFYNHLPNRVQTKRESALQMELINGSRIVALPGKEETIRGYSGVDLLIVDEAARVPNELYYSVRPMLAVSGGRLVALSTPFGRRGWFFHEWTEGGEDWHRTQITAAQVRRITPEFLAEERRSMGDWWYRQEYQCEFLDTMDQVFGFDDVTNAFFVEEVEPLFNKEKWSNLWATSTLG